MRLHLNREFQQVYKKGKRRHGKGFSIISTPNGEDNMELLMNWVENNQAPAKTLVVDPKGKISDKAEGAGYLLCSYPNYPKYVSGPADQASSYISADR